MELIKLPGTQEIYLGTISCHSRRREEGWNSPERKNAITEATLK
jgi:hypothetical protein